MFGVDRRRNPRHWCGSTSLRSPSPSSTSHLDGEERRVVDLDADPLDRRDQHIAIAVLAQDRGEQLHQRRAADRRAAGRTRFRRRRCACRSRRNTGGFQRCTGAGPRSRAARGFAEAGQRLVGRPAAVCVFLVGRHNLALIVGKVRLQRVGPDLGQRRRTKHWRRCASALVEPARCGRGVERLRRYRRIHGHRRIRRRRRQGRRSDARAHRRRPRGDRRGDFRPGQGRRADAGRRCWPAVTAC